MRKRKNRLGQINLENIISAFTGAEEGKPAMIIEHKVDTPTLIALGAIGLSIVGLNYYLTR